MSGTPYEPFVDRRMEMLSGEIETLRRAVRTATAESDRLVGTVKALHAAVSAIMPVKVVLEKVRITVDRSNLTPVFPFVSGDESDDMFVNSGRPWEFTSFAAAVLDTMSDNMASVVPAHVDRYVVDSVVPTAWYPMYDNYGMGTPTRCAPTRATMTFAGRTVPIEIDRSVQNDGFSVVVTKDLRDLVADAALSAATAGTELRISFDLVYQFDVPETT